MIDSPVQRRMLIAALLAVGVVVCSGGAASAVHQPSDSSTGRPAIALTPYQQYVGTIPRQAITVAVRPNGTGIVTVQYRLSLNTANETAAFRQLRANITANPSNYRTRFGTRMEQVVASARTATGRQMTVKQPTINATRRGTTGIVTYSFVWTNFATSSNGSIRVGDALSGFYLDDGQQLTITWPAEYELATVRPPPDSRGATALRWTASTTFGETDPLVELVRTNQRATKPPSATGVPSPSPNSSVGTASIGASLVGTNASSGDQTDTPGNASGAADGTDPSNEGEILSTTDQLQVLLVVIGAVVIGLALLAAIVYRRHRDHGQHSQSSSDEPTITDPDSERTRETAASEDPQAALLSNEERVIQVLEHAGGRAKQQHIVEELGWTEAKTSQVVSDLRDDGTINSFRLGRENVLSLADTESEDDEPASG